MAIFDPHRINTPLPITKKFGTGDYVGGPSFIFHFLSYPLSFAAFAPISEVLALSNMKSWNMSLIGLLMLMLYL